MSECIICALMEDTVDHKLTVEDVAIHAFLLGVMSEAHKRAEDATGVMCDRHKEIARDVLDRYEEQLDGLDQNENETPN
jgi:hypothetical protein